MTTPATPPIIDIHPAPTDVVVVHLPEGATARVHHPIKPYVYPTQAPPPGPLFLVIPGDHDALDWGVSHSVYTSAAAITAPDSYTGPRGCREQWALAIAQLPLGGAVLIHHEEHVPFVEWIRWVVTGHDVVPPAEAPKPVAPPETLFADYATGLLALHTTWDNFHELRTLTWDGTGIGTNVLHAIHPSVPPEFYPDYIRRVADKEISEQLASGQQTLYGFSLQYEGYMATPFADLAPDEQERLAEDFRNHTVRHRSDAIEVALIYLVDIHDRVWIAVKQRKSGLTEYRHYTDPATKLHPFIGAMRRAALDVAQQIHGHRTNINLPF
ncbi:hypothetical protein [Sphaerisporangium aureirubrum]|uniref:Uncharacterized protein n=1 Tax=Sphaerisporangium aureirubrum TaxID=1544736 RepID=A0ABW1NCA8_9ACTN